MTVYSLDQVLRALAALRADAGLAPEQFPVEAFVGMMKAVYVSGEPLPVMPVAEPGSVVKEEAFGETMDRVRDGCGWGLGFGVWGMR